MSEIVFNTKYRKGDKTQYKLKRSKLKLEKSQCLNLHIAQFHEIPSFRREQKINTHVYPKDKIMLTKRTVCHSVAYDNDYTIYFR